MNRILSGCLIGTALFSLTPMAQAIDIQRWTTPQGSQVLLVERHDLPIVDYTVIFKGAGSTADPEGKSNIAAATAQLLVSGTTQLDEEQFNSKINDLASNIETGNSFEYSNVSFRSLSDANKLNATADLFNQAITQPRFDANALQRIKDQAILSLKQSESYPDYLASRELTRLNYPHHPYGKSAYQTVEKIQSIQQQDLVNFHKKNYTQNQAIIAIVGDITRPQAEALITRTLSNVSTHINTNTAAPKVEIIGGKRKNLPYPHSTQTSISMGLPVLTADDPDYFAMLVGNYILGGGEFDSRLMKELRDKKGYTYGVTSSLSAYTQAAPFTITFSTENQNAKEALASAQKVLADFIAQGPTATELKQAKDSITGAFPLRFDTNGKLLGNLMAVGVHNRPTDWFDTYNDKIHALTVDDIKRAWQRKIQPTQLNIVVVGGKNSAKP